MNGGRKEKGSGGSGRGGKERDGDGRIGRRGGVGIGGKGCEWGEEREGERWEWKGREGEGRRWENREKGRDGEVTRGSDVLGDYCAGS